VVTSAVRDTPDRGNTRSLARAADRQHCAVGNWPAPWPAHGDPATTPPKPSTLSTAATATAAWLMRSSGQKTAPNSGCGLSAFRHQYRPFVQSFPSRLLKRSLAARVRAVSSPLSTERAISMEPSFRSSADNSPETSSLSSKPVQRKKTVLRPYSSSALALTAPKVTRPSPRCRSGDRPV
jgi:hypothetical protein